MIVQRTHGHLEATALGASWRVSDEAVADEDPNRVVAFIDSRDEDVEVVWLRGSAVPPGRFRHLDDALDAIDDVLTKGEERRHPIHDVAGGHR